MSPRKRTKLQEQRRLRQFVLRIDVPQCDCPTWDEEGELLPFCGHFLERFKTLREFYRSMTDEEFLALLRAANPREIRELPLPEQPTRTITPLERAQIYAERAARGESVFHPKDSPLDPFFLGRDVGTHPNGVVFSRGLHRG